MERLEVLNASGVHAHERRDAELRYLRSLIGTPLAYNEGSW